MEEEGAICVVVNAARKTASCFFSLSFFLSLQNLIWSRRQPRRGVGRIFALLRRGAPLGPSASLTRSPRRRGGRGEAERGPLGFIALTFLSRWLLLIRTDKNFPRPRRPLLQLCRIREWTMECGFKLKVELPLLHRVRVSWRRRGAGTLLCVLLSIVRPMRSWAHLPAIIGRSELPCAYCLPLADRAALCNTWNESPR